mgnify:CR=1 FL=1
MLSNWPLNNNGYCLIVHQLAQWRPPRCYTGIVNSNLPSGKSLVARFFFSMTVLVSECRQVQTTEAINESFDIGRNDSP